MSVELAGVIRRFGPTPALHGLDLAVREGELLALIGPSGAGKSTAMRLIAGLDTPDEGRITIGGADMSGVPARKRRVGYVFQSYALFRHMTVAQNIGFGLRVRSRRERPSSRDVASRVADLLALVQLPGIERRYPDQLSGGQRQRVALARALAIEPRVLLLDEPFGAIDAWVRRDLRRSLRRLHDRLDLTTILVTHDQDEALELADRVAVLRDGRLEQVAEPGVLLERPATPFVDLFLGRSERVPVMVCGGVAHPQGLPIAPWPAALPDGPGIALARPHEIGIAPDPDGGWRVRAIIPQGHLMRIEVETAERTLDIVREPTPDLTVGARCRVTLARARTYLGA